MKIRCKSCVEFGTLAPSTPFQFFEEDGSVTFWIKAVEVNGINAVNLVTGMLDGFAKGTKVNAIRGEFVGE